MKIPSVWPFSFAAAASGFFVLGVEKPVTCSMAVHQWRHTYLGYSGDARMGGMTAAQSGEQRENLVIFPSLWGCGAPRSY